MGISKSNKYSFLVFLILTVIIPAVLHFSTGIFKVAESNVVNIMIFVGYEIVAFLISIMSGVSSELKNTWAKRIAGSIDLFMQSIMLKYKSNYFDYINYENRFFDLKGITQSSTYYLELIHVYVSLKISKWKSHENSNNPIPTRELNIDDDSYYLKDLMSSKSEGLGRYKSLAIIGPPGSGKTTLLKHSALILSVKYKGTGLLKRRLFPILINLRDIPAIITDENKLMLPDVLIAVLKGKFDKLKMPNVDWFRNKLNKGNCFVMLDGLDEVADSEIRDLICNWIERQTIAYPNNHFAVTSRPHGYQANPLRGFIELEVDSFNFSQISSFIKNWYLATEIKNANMDDEGVRLQANNEAEELISRIQNSDTLSDLAVNPLLLTMIVTVHKYKSALPKRRVELYSQICEVFLGQRKRAKGIELKLTPLQKKRVLQPLAYHMMMRNIREIQLENAKEVIGQTLKLVDPSMEEITFIEDMHNDSGLFLEKEKGVYGFAHLTFQEYLSSVHIKEQGLEKMLSAKINDSWWRETIRLYVAQSDGTRILEACLKDGKPSALALAVECSDEALELSHKVREELTSKVEEFLNDPDTSKRSPVAEAILNHRLYNRA